jgi:hypothetical protein
MKFKKIQKTSPKKYKWFKKEVDYINDHSFKKPKRQKKYMKQLENRGWTDADTWSLDSTFGRWISPRLKRFKKLNNGCPNGLTAESWNAILDIMIEAFEYIGSDKYWGARTDKMNAKIEQGLDLFRQYFFCLWW